MHKELTKQELEQLAKKISDKILPEIKGMSVEQLVHVLYLAESEVKKSAFVG